MMMKILRGRGERGSSGSSGLLCVDDFNNNLQEAGPAPITVYTLGEYLREIEGS